MDRSVTQWVHIGVLLVCPRSVAFMLMQRESLILRDGNCILKTLDQVRLDSVNGWWDIL